MNLTPIKTNMTELNLDGGLTVLFSYKSPVAVKWSNGQEYQYIKTAKKWSNTTTRHINTWLNGREALVKPQEYFDNLIAEVK